MDRNGQHRDHHPKAPLAIIGMACRFAGGAVDAETFWELLASGRSGIVEIPADRWNGKRYYHPDTAVPNRMHTHWGGFIDQLHDFDARFWGISPREAARMDPQQRWLLEVAWEAIEDAGVPPQKLSGTKTGVFVGISSSDYAQIQMTNHFGLDVHSNSGNTLSIASNRISYALDLKGPSMSIDTACSSSLVAVSLACHSIWDGTCEGALVGGVNAVIVPSTTMAFSKATMLSPDGQCFAFDSRANGYVRGDGAGAVYIKPLARAREDGDPIYAVIRAAVANQDGKTSSMMVPGFAGQVDMLEQAYEQAGIRPSRVRFVEAHGTGTPLGDPIEASALGEVLSRGRALGDCCLLGSVKTNIGHLEAGSGIAGLMKAVLALHKNAVPPNLNFRNPNPSIPFDRLQLKVATELTELPVEPGHPNVAAVNSFGFGGTNAHVVLEAAPAPTARPAATGTRPPADRPCLLPISARDDVALRNYVKAYSRLLREAALPLADMCYSAGARKEHHGQRLAVMGRSHEEMREKLSAWLGNPEGADGVVTGNAAPKSGPITFVFTGQGPQWWGMGQQLLEREPLVRRTIERIDDKMRRLGDWSLLEEMTRPEETSCIDETHIAQPAIFALQVALAELWKSWGIVPDKVIGHSVGEVAAAYCAGIYNLDDAVKVAFHRSRLQHTTRGQGRMVAAGISAAEARELIGSAADVVHISGINSPSLVTLSGDTESLAAIVEQLEQNGKFFRWLGIDYAFHTHQMDPIRDELLQVLADIHPRPGRIPMVSTVTGGVLLGENFDANYWWKNVRLPVLFAPGMESLIRGGSHLFVEIGPHPSLRSTIEDCLADAGQRGGVFYSLRRDTDESNELLTNLAGLYTSGVAVDWQAINHHSTRFVRLPRYPWTQEAFWNESDRSERIRLMDTIHPLLGLPIDAEQPTWEFALDPRLFPYVNDHKLWGSVVFPAAGYAEIGLAVAREAFPDQPLAVEDIDIKKALFAWEDKLTTVRVVLEPVEKTLAIYSSTGAGMGGGDGWELHAEARLIPLASQPSEPVDLRNIRESLSEYIDHEQYYDELIAAGYGFGPSFRHIQNVWRTGGESLAEIEVPVDLHASLGEYHFHPAVMDACFQAFKALQETEQRTTTDYLFLPSAIRRVRLHQEQPPTHLWAHAKQTVADGNSLTCDIAVYDNTGRLVADILGFRVEPVEQKAGGDEIENCLYRFEWELCRLRGTGVEGSCNFSSSDVISQTTQAAALELYEQFGFRDRVRDYLPRTERLLLQYVQNAFLKLGWRPAAGDVFRFSEFVRQLGVVRQHYRVAKIQLRALEDGGLIRNLGDDQWEVLRAPQARNVDDEMAALAAEYPRMARTELALSKINAEAAHEILTGEVTATELLFPGGSGKLVGQFYVDALDFPAHNQLIPLAIKKALENLPPHRALRVLEVGAGTGSLTREVLKVLPADRTEYVFTDVGPAFLTAARHEFCDYPFIDYQTFDLEKPAGEQGLQPHGYDLILASAVLHATEDLRRTLANIEWCLAEDGMLLFLEPIHRRATTDTIFGGLPGWWKFTDTDLRPHHALMERAKWERLLADCGYRDVGSVISAPTDEEAEQAILFATAPLFAGRHGGATPDINQATHLSLSAEERLPKTHLVFADEGGVAAVVIERLRQHGDRVIQVRVGESFRQEDDECFTISAESTAELRQLIEDLGKIHTVSHFWSLDHPSIEQLSLDALTAAQRTGVLHAKRLVGALGSWEPESPPRVYFVMRDVQHVIAGDASSQLASAPLVGLARVANAEHIQFHWTTIDLPATRSPRESEQLFQELARGDQELEIAYRDGRRYANRLHRVRANDLPRRMQPAIDATGQVIPYRLQIDKPGVLANLSLNETRRRDLEPNEIEVALSAGGINFRDVMKALGMYPGNPVDLRWFGDDFAGVVQRVGVDVDQFAVGDRVAGIAPYSFRSYAVTNWQTVFRVPEHVSLEGAATLPTVFLTAQYAIRRLAQMEPGEKILIHAATGGVGQAAIQIAQHLGLEIFATAGTDEKRQLLADLGVPHVMDSRTLDFADRVMEITRGRGVDAVLNSLAGPFVAKSCSVLAPFGRFLEIGKVDVYNNTKIGLEMLKHNVSYFVIDLAECLQAKPGLVASMFAELAERFETGEFRPLQHQVFPVTDVVEAFRYMAQGKHIGKNVLNFDCGQLRIGPCTEEGHLFRPGASYLITGGAGGFGLEVAKWMARHGAESLILMSRGGPRGNAEQASIDQLRENGVNVVDARGDVTQPADVRRVVQDIQDSHPPLRGVVHGAMVLDDDFLVDLDDERFTKVMHPKMLGAWNLHQETLGIPLDHFICFSSFSDVAGGARQANYNAGNFFLDCLAFYRRGQGLPALTFNWGGISGAGFVHRNEKITQYFEKIGFQSFTVDEALRLIRMVMQYDPVQMAVARLDWQSMERFSSFVAESNMFAQVTRETRQKTSGAAARPTILAAPPEERLALVKSLLAAQLAAVCNVDAAKVDHDTSIMKLGLDSLMAIELINRVENELALVVPMGKVLGGPTLSELAETVVQLLTYSADDAPGADGTAGSGGSSLALMDTPDEPFTESPLSQHQRGLWFLAQLQPHGPSPNIGLAANVRPALEMKLLNHAWELLLSRHPMLTVTFADDAGELLQRADAAAPAKCAIHAVTQMSNDGMQELLDRVVNEPFDMQRGPVIRLHLVTAGEDSSVLVLAASRLVCDAWSMTLIINDLMENYRLLADGKQPDRLATDYSYKDFVVWEQGYLDGETAQRTLAFWKEQLLGAPALLNLPTDRPRPPLRTCHGQSAGFQLDDELAHRVKVFAAEQTMPLRPALLSVFDLLMHGWCGQQDLLVGCEFTGRDQPELMNVVGCVGGPVPLRSDISDDPTFLELLQRTHKRLEDVRDHQRLPLSRVMSQLHVPRDHGRPPLCQVGFAMQRDPGHDEQGLASFLLGQRGPRARFGNWSLESLDVMFHQTPYELMLSVEEAGGEIFGSWQFNRDLFEPDSIAAINLLYGELLAEVMRNPQERVSRVLQSLAVRERLGSAARIEPPSLVPSTIGDPLDDSDRAVARQVFIAPRTQTEHLVARVWEQVLDVRPVGVRDDFFELGGHSLAVADVCARLLRMFSVQIPSRQLFASPTVEGLASMIDDCRDADSPPIVDPMELEFEADGQLDPFIVAPLAAQQPAEESFERVLLTGASGFLGAFLLDELLRQTPADVVCLVRASSPRHGLQRIRQNLEKYGLFIGDAIDRVTPLVGDLAKPRFGLIDEEFDQLATEIDVIYHNGAVLNFAYSYPVLRETNVQGTHEVLRLAMQHRLKPTHYVSTVAVHASNERNAWEIVAEDDPLPSFSSLRDAYSQTKWMSEKLIAEAGARGLPVTIYRPAGITGHSETGRCNTGDLVHVMALGCFHLGTIPHMDIEFNLAPVDFVARALVELSRQRDSAGKTYHLVNTDPLKLETLMGWVQSTELDVERMPFEHWQQQMSALIEAMPSDVFGLLTKSFMPGVVSGDLDDAIPQVLRLRYDCRHTQRALSNSDVKCPIVDERMLALYLSHLQQSGLVATAGSE